MYPSKKAYDPRAFNSFWRPFIRVFQALCLSHYSIFRSTEHASHLAYFILFSTFDILSTVWAQQSIQLKDITEYKNSLLMYYVSCTTIFAHIVVYSIAHFESFATRNQENAIYQRLREIDEVFATKLNYVRDFDAIRKRYVWPTVRYWIFVATTSLATALFSIPYEINSITFLSIHSVNVILNRVRRCQISLHINALTNILKDLKILLEREQRNYCSKSEKSTENNRHIRHIYSNVWLIVKLMDNCFGWTLIACLIEFSIDLINSSHQAYLNFKLYRSTYHIIRNFS